MSFSRIILPENKITWSRKSIHNRRYYVDSENNHKLPSISSVLSARPSEWLNEWKNNVGEDEANRVSRKALQMGTQLHKASENYLNNIQPFQTCSEVKMFVPMVVSRFNRFRKILDRIDKIYFQEFMMGSSKIGIGGTVDCIAEFDGILSIIDFKTSKREKDLDSIKGYMTQETAYAIMFFEMFGIKINNLVTLISVEDGEDQVFITEPKLHHEYLIESKEIYDKKLKEELINEN